MHMKVNEKEKYYYNYSKLLGRIRELYDTQEKFAAVLGIGRVSLSQRLNNKLEFSQNEILKSCQLLNIAKYQLSDYFFQEKEMQPGTSKK